MAYTVVLHKNPGYPNFGIYIGDDVPYGLYVVTTEPNSPAAQANIRPGDRVLAFNGQQVSSLSRNARDILVQTAATAQTLTLSMEPSDSLDGINIRPNSTVVYRETYPNSSQTTNFINNDLESYIKTLFSDPTLQIVSVPSSNQNEYMLVSDKDASQPYYPNFNLRRRKHRQSRRGLLDLADGKGGRQFLSATRSVPNMGTSHTMLRHNRDHPNYNQQNNNLVNPPAYTAAMQLANNSVNPGITENNAPPTVKDPSLREVHMQRVPDFQGFGFHLQYNKVYYIIQRIEENSPAANSGLRENDVVREVNHEPTDQMPHNRLIQLINTSSKLTFLVQPFDDYFRANPHIPPKSADQPSQTPVADKIASGKRSTIFGKALTKLKSR
ncbi:unnamed protein product [Adineta ricciae]|uniref:PDZ domain-containing protein n=1 Tax=Adineta ricciae TaxID=249248 RepID=A0A815SB75_ADIRI|nr:unnamed protein product [Adineta ricciae]CAF1489661.1 unnamed protein product [Adineta ricciae]